MFALPAARIRAGIDCSVRVALPALCALFLPGAVHADPQAESILKKMQTLYQTAKTYKGTIKSNQHGKGPDNKPISRNITQEIRYKAPNLFYIRVSISGGTGAGAAGNGSQTVACDGKNIYQYISTRNQYVKQAAPATAPKLGPMGFNFPLNNAKMLPASSVSGRPVYMIQIERPMPPNVPANQQAKVKPLLKVNLAVDKSNYYLLRISAANGENATDFVDQTVNGSLSDSSFAFVPPAGATLFTPPAQPAPGAPGGAPVLPGGPPKK
jgi:outer membrane lipoprotein-sorting protein